MTTDEAEARLESLKAWMARAAEHQEWLAAARGGLEDDGPDALRVWIGETLTEAQARDLLVIALMLYHETSRKLHDGEDS